MKYVEKHFALRIHRGDGSSKLLLGVIGSPPKAGSLKQIKVAKNQVLMVEITAEPRGEEPAEAIEVRNRVSATHNRRARAASQSDHVEHCSLNGANEEAGTAYLDIGDLLV
jgi:hypothetical protein